MQIEGKGVLVTGGASGLGEATVRLFHSCGAGVVIADQDQQAGSRLAQDLGPRADFVCIDVTDPAGARRAVEQVVARWKGLHVLVQCAGVVLVEKVLGREDPHDLERFRRVVEVNLVGTFNLLRLAAESMKNNPPQGDGERGVVVNTASIAAFEGQIGQVAYAASKAGVIGLTLPAARELGRHGIRVVTVAPGIFDTPMMASLPDPVRQALAREIPFPSRLGRPAEFALLVRHIVENPLLNGTTLRLDGGLRMGPR